MSCIVTFYSYKGGVGRSMALANIAVLLARQDLKVLAVDWDLEAPGLERYFGYFEIKPGGPGLLRMCMEARDKGTADFRNFTSSFQCEAKYPITLLPSGREQDDSYSRNLEAFDWEEFFDKQGGHFVESLRQRWRDEFDIVLIDSRTGSAIPAGFARSSSRTSLWPCSPQTIRAYTAYAMSCVSRRKRGKVLLTIACRCRYCRFQRDGAFTNFRRRRCGWIE